MKLEELTSTREIRGIIKEKFNEYRDVTDPRVRGGVVVQWREEATAGQGVAAGGGGDGGGVLQPQLACQHHSSSSTQKGVLTAPGPLSAPARLMSICLAPE
jgi:hypothetical protein